MSYSGVSDHYNDLYEGESHPFGRKPDEYVSLIPNFLPHGRILDLGCGYGRATIFLSKNPRYEIDAVDISEEGIEKLLSAVHGNPGRVNATVEDIYTFVPAHRYDCIIASYVLHHLTTAAGNTLLARMKQWTMPNGLNLVNTFTDEGDAYQQSKTGGENHFYPTVEHIRKCYFTWDIEIMAADITRMHSKNPDGSHMKNGQIKLLASNKTD